MALDTTIGGTDADSYVTLAEYQERAAALDWELAGSDAEDEVILRRAAVALDASYIFVGRKQYQFQAREWPRLEVPLIQSWPTNPDTIPRPIKNAQMEMAQIIQSGTDPLEVFEGAVKRVREKADVLEEETEYTGGRARPRFTAVDRILRDYVRAGTGQMQVVRG